MENQPHQDLFDLPTGALLAKLGAGGHKPGSGSAAALISLVACKLLQTVVSLSDGRGNYEGVKEQLTLANQDITESIEPVLTRLMNEDAVQFGKVIALRTERNNEKDPKVKKQLAEKALNELKKSTEIPYEIASKSIEIAEKGFTVFDLGFKAARGDSGVAISSALGGASGALTIIYLNLTSFKGGEWATEMRSRADEVNAKIQRLQVGLFARINKLQSEVLDKEKISGTVERESQ